MSHPPKKHVKLGIAQTAIQPSTPLIVQSLCYTYFLWTQKQKHKNNDFKNADGYFDIDFGY